MKIEWKKVGMGVFAAGLGAAIFGAVHYMFLAGQTPAGGLLGVSYSVIVPVVLGVVGFVISMAVKPGYVREIISYGSAAAIGFGVATYATWITPANASARARASVPAMASVPRTAMMPVPTTSSASAGVKLI